MPNWFRKKQEWVLRDMDPDTVKRSGLPVVMPIPASELQHVGDDGVDLSEAVSWAREYLKDNPKTDLAPSLTKFIKKVPLLDRADELHEQGRWAEVLDVLTRAVKVDPDDLRAHCNLAHTYEHMGRPHEALAEYEDCVRIGGETFDVWCGRSLVYEGMGDTEKAIAGFRKALEIQPDDAVRDKLVELGALVRVFSDSEDPDSVEYLERSEWREILRDDWKDHLGDVEHLLNHARSQADPDPELSLEAVDLALAADPNSAEAWLTKGYALSRLARLPEARTAFQRCVELDPKSDLGHANLASAVADEEGYEAALPYVDKALAIDPNLIGAIRVFAIPKGADFGKCISLTRQLIKRYPTAWAPHCVLGDLYLQLHDNQAGYREYDEAIRKGADDENTALYLRNLLDAGLIRELCAVADRIADLPNRGSGVLRCAADGYLAAGRKSNARSLYEKLLEITQDPGTKRELQESIASL